MGGDLLPGGSIAMATLVLDRTWVQDPSAPVGRSRLGRQIAMVTSALVVTAAFVAGALYLAHGERAQNTPVHSVTGRSPSTKAASTTSSTVATTGSTAGSTTTTVAGFDYAMASLRIQQLNYQPSDSEQGSGPLYVVLGMCAGSADGYCQNAFFFYNNTYLGTDVSGIDVGVSVQWTTSDIIALTYPVYAPGDPNCCPTGGSRLVRFEWNGSKLVPIDPLPSDPNSTTGKNP